MRYPIENKDGSVHPDKYSITFTRTAYDPEQNLWVKQLENDQEFRQLIFQQHEESSELASRHAQERVQYLARKRRAERQEREEKEKEPQRDPTSIELGVTIKRLRVQQGWTLGTLRKESGLSLPLLSLLEDGKRELSLDRLRRLAGAFDMSPSELLATAVADAS